MIELDQGGRARSTARWLPVPPDLAPIVERVAVYRVPAAGRGWRIVPDASPHLLHHRFGDGSTRTGLVGARPSYVDIRPGRRAYSVVLRLHPGALPVLVGHSAWELRNRSVDLPSVWGRHGRLAAQRLDEARSPTAALGLLLGLVRGFARGRPDWRARGLTDSLNGDPSLRIGDVARRLGVGERGLRTAVAQHIGLRPKEVQRIVRLQQALLHSTRGLPDEKAAIRVGFVDHPHYISECRALMGETPSSFRARGVASVA